MQHIHRYIVAWYTPGICESRLEGTSWNTYYYHCDTEGTTREVTDSLQRITDAYAYNAWGEDLGQLRPTTDQAKPVNPLRYIGKEGYYTDTDTGLMLLGARYYDPLIGRFITQDPDRDGLNWYEYADNNPVNKIDPTGLRAKKLGANQKSFVDAAISMIGNVDGWGSYAAGLKNTDIYYDSNLYVAFQKASGQSVNFGPLHWIKLDDSLEALQVNPFESKLTIATTLVHERTHMLQPWYNNDEEQAWGSELHFLTDLYRDYGQNWLHGFPLPPSGGVAAARTRVFDYYNTVIDDAHSLGLLGKYRNFADEDAFNWSILEAGSFE